MIKKVEKYVRIRKIFLTDSLKKCFFLSFFQIDEKEVDLIKVNLRQEEEEKYHGGSRMSISSRRSSVSSVGSRLLAGGRMGRAKDQTKETASQQHAAKLVANTTLKP